MKGNLSAPAVSRKVGKRTYRKVSCSLTKAGATKKKNALRKRGYSAMVVGKCVYKGPKLKKATTKRKTTARRRRRA